MSAEAAAAAEPLSGRRIVVTRAADATSRMAEPLRALGAEVLELPLIRIEADLDVDRAEAVFDEFAHYEWLLFTSANGVRHFFRAFFARFDDIRSLGFIRIAAVGQATAQALAALHLRPEFVPDTQNAAGLAESIAAEQSLDNLRLLVVTGNRNRPELVQALEAERAIVDTLRVYATRFTDLSDDPAARSFRERGADALVFASASAVQSFGEQARHLQLGSDAQRPALVSFGPQTTAAMQAAGIPLALEIEEPSAQALAKAMVAHFR